MWLPLREVSGNPLKPITAAILSLLPNMSHHCLCPAYPSSLPDNYQTPYYPSPPATTHSICGYWRPMWLVVTRVTVGLKSEGLGWELLRGLKLGDQNWANLTNLVFEFPISLLSVYIHVFVISTSIVFFCPISYFNHPRLVSWKVKGLVTGHWSSVVSPPPGMESTLFILATPNNVHSTFIHLTSSEQP